MDDFALHNSYNNSTMELPISQDDSRLIKPIISKMNTWLLRLTSNLWLHLNEKEEQKAINAAPCVALQPKAMLPVTIAVDNVMETKDPNNVSPNLLDAIRKE